jgi:hypothetical protein
VFRVAGAQLGKLPGQGSRVGVPGRESPGSKIPGQGGRVGVPGRGSLRPPAASRCSALRAARSFPRRPPAYVLRAVDASQGLPAGTRTTLTAIARFVHSNSSHSKSFAPGSALLTAASLRNRFAKGASLGSHFAQGRFAWSRPHTAAPLTVAPHTAAPLTPLPPTTAPPRPIRRSRSA